METKHAYPKEVIRTIVQKMVADKKNIQEYIKKNGSINGFSDESIIFAKPI